MIFVVAEIELVDGKCDEFLAAFHELVPLVLEEDGCIEYGPALDVESSIDAQLPTSNNRVTVMEKWESLESLEKHLVAPHMLSFRSKVGELVTGTTLKVLEPAEKS